MVVVVVVTLNNGTFGSPWVGNSWATKVNRDVKKVKRKGWAISGVLLGIAVVVIVRIKIVSKSVRGEATDDNALSQN